MRNRTSETCWWLPRGSRCRCTRTLLAILEHLPAGKSVAAAAVWSLDICMFDASENSDNVSTGVREPCSSEMVGLVSCLMAQPRSVGDWVGGRVRSCLSVGRVSRRRAPLGHVRWGVLPECRSLLPMATQGKPACARRVRRVQGDRRSLATWLILPVVICLSQRLSHACASINAWTVRLRMAH